MIYRSSSSHRAYRARGGCVSWRLNTGTPAPLVAEWAGCTVEVLFRIYAHCMDRDDERRFGPMEDALRRGETRPDRALYRWRQRRLVWPDGERARPELTVVT